MQTPRDGRGIGSSDSTCCRVCWTEAQKRSIPATLGNPSIRRTHRVAWLSVSVFTFVTSTFCAPHSSHIIRKLGNGGASPGFATSFFQHSRHIHFSFCFGLFIISPSLLIASLFSKIIFHSWESSQALVSFLSKQSKGPAPFGVEPSASDSAKSPRRRITQKPLEFNARCHHTY